MRTVGVEIEFEGDVNAVIQGLISAGLSSRTSRHSYMGHSNSEWVVKLDGSVSRGGELVSPPLNFDDASAREQITRACQVLQAAGAQPSQATGVHIHVGCGDLTVKQVVAVAKNFFKYEDIIYRLASSGWRTIRQAAVSYAPPLSEDRAKAIAKARTLDALMQAWYGHSRGRDYARDHSDSSRYCGLNLHSYFYRQTIEFRVFNGTVNGDRLQAYVAMCVALVHDARKGNSRSVNAAYRLGGMHSGALVEKNIWHRFLQVLRYEADMSKEDMALLQACWKDSMPQARFATAR
jgi:hypothetical protein